MKHTLLTILVSSVFIYLIYLYYISPIHYENTLKISVKEARSRRFGLVIDVRTLDEREKLGYYPNSILLEKITDPLEVSKNMWILVYSGDNRAAVAAETLYRMGYKNVKYITESYLRLMPGW